MSDSIGKHPDSLAEKTSPGDEPPTLLATAERIGSISSVDSRSQQKFIDLVKSFLCNQISLHELHSAAVKLFGEASVLKELTNELIHMSEEHKLNTAQLEDIVNDFKVIPLGPLGDLITNPKLRSQVMARSSLVTYAANESISLIEPAENPFEKAAHDRELEQQMRRQRVIKSILRDCAEDDLLNDPVRDATRNAKWYPVPAFPLGPAWGHTLHRVGDLVLMLGGGNCAAASRFDTLTLLDLKSLAHRFVPTVGCVPPPKDKAASVAVRVRPSAQSTGGLMVVLFGGNVPAPAPGTASVPSGSSLGDSQDILGGVSSSCFVLDVHRARWAKLPRRGAWPCARMGHSLLAMSTGGEHDVTADEEVDDLQGEGDADMNGGKGASKKARTDKDPSSSASRKRVDSVLRSKRLKGEGVLAAGGYTRNIILFGGHTMTDASAARKGVRRSLNDLWVLDIEAGWLWSEIRLEGDMLHRPVSRECATMTWVSSDSFCLFGGACFEGDAERMLQDHGLIAPRDEVQDESERALREDAIKEAQVSLECVPTLLADLWVCKFVVNASGRITGAKWEQCPARGQVPSPRASHVATVTHLSVGDAGNDPLRATLQPILVVATGQTVEKETAAGASKTGGAGSTRLIKPSLPNLDAQLCDRAPVLELTDSVAVYNFRTQLWHSLSPGSGVAFPPTLATESQDGAVLTARSSTGVEPRASAASVLLHATHQGSSPLNPALSNPPTVRAAWGLGGPTLLLHGGFASVGILGDAYALSLTGQKISGSLHEIQALGLRDNTLPTPALPEFSRLNFKRGSLAALVSPPVLVERNPLVALPPESISPPPPALNAPPAATPTSAIPPSNADANAASTSSAAAAAEDVLKPEGAAPGGASSAAMRLLQATSQTVPSPSAATIAALRNSQVYNKTGAYPQPPPGTGSRSLPQEILIAFRAAGSGKMPRSLSSDHISPERLWTLRRVAARATRPTYSHYLPWMLGATIASPLHALGLLFDNCAQDEVGASRVHVHGMVTSRKYRTLVVDDDGCGLTPPQLCSMLNSYASSDPSQMLDVNVLSPYPADQGISLLPRYGIGFKLALGRLAAGCVVLTKTATEMQIGLVSSELNISANALEMATPIVCFPLTSNSPRVRRAAMERAIAHHCPFTPSELALEAQRLLDLPDVCATRLVFFLLRNDVDQLVFHEHDVSICPPQAVHPRVKLLPECFLRNFAGKHQENLDRCFEAVEAYKQALGASALHHTDSSAAPSEAPGDEDMGVGGSSSQSMPPLPASPIPVPPPAAREGSRSRSNTPGGTKGSRRRGRSPSGPPSSSASPKLAPVEPTPPVVTVAPYIDPPTSDAIFEGVRADPSADDYQLGMVSKADVSMRWDCSDVMFEHRVSAPKLYDSSAPELPKDEDEAFYSTANSAFALPGRAADEEMKGNNAAAEAVATDLRKVLSRVDRERRLVDADTTRSFYDAETPLPLASLVNSGEAQAVAESLVAVRDRIKQEHVTPGQTIFPFWSQWSESPDASLRTALFWRSIFLPASSVNLRVQSAPSALALLRPELREQTPFEILRSRLHRCVLSQFLLDPSDYAENGWIMLGFMQDPATAPAPIVATSSKSSGQLKKLSSTAAAEEHRRQVCEMGVNLYSSGRHIARLGASMPQLPDYVDAHQKLKAGMLSTEVLQRSVSVLGFPVTVMVGVPARWLPAAHMCSFVDQQSPAFKLRLTDRIIALVTEYLHAVVAGTEAQWGAEREARFDDWLARQYGGSELAEVVQAERVPLMAVGKSKSAKK